VGLIEHYQQAILPRPSEHTMVAQTIPEIIGPYQNPGFLLERKINRCVAELQILREFQKDDPYAVVPNGSCCVRTKE
jgi:hypothetical protein